MLSDEERQAIEYLKRHIIPYYGRKGTIEFMLNDTLLNLIEKQSKEIEELKGIKFENERTIELFIEGYKRIYKGLDIKSLVMNENILINEIKENFTSNDKIKAKIEEVQNMKAKAKDIVFKSSLNYIETELKSLLEKE